MGHPPIFKATALPGRKEGVSGSYIISTNLGVSNYIDKGRRKAALEFIKFIALKETHKKYIINNHFFSAITELYDDEEVCKVIECDIIKNSYPFSFMNNDVNLFGNDNYQKKYREIIFEYLYKDKPINEVLKKINDISKIYTFSLKTDDSNIGLIIFIISLIFLTIMVLSLIFLFIKKLDKRFQFLSKDLWIITTLGSIILLSSIFTLYGDVTNVNCHLRATLINVGFILSICPSLYKLIINLPKRNKVSKWFENNKYISILIIMIFSMSLNGIFAISLYDLQNLITSDEKNYLKCIMNNKYGSLAYYIIVIYDLFIILISLFLIFLEWNLKETYIDVNLLAAALFMDILSLFLLNIIDNIKFKGYIIYNILLAINILIFSISNHFFIYFVRILPIFGKNPNYEYSRTFLKNILNSDLNNLKNLSDSPVNDNETITKTQEITSTTSTTCSNDTTLKRISKTIMSCHNQTSISK